MFRREVQWTTRYINTKKIEYACRLVNRQETAEFVLVREQENDAAAQLHKVLFGLRGGRFRASGVPFHPLAFVTDKRAGLRTGLLFSIGAAQTEIQR